MRHENLLEADKFFSLTWDYLEVYIPIQHGGGENTKKSYEDALTIFRRYISNTRNLSIRNFKFSDCTYDFILDYRNFLSEKYKPTTVNQRVEVLKTYLHYAALRRTEIMQIYLNISDVPHLTVPKTIRPIIEEDEMLSAFLAAPSHSKIGIRDSIILLVLYDTAMRVDELVNLNLSDISLSPNKPFVHIYGKGEKERNVPISIKSVPHFEQYVKLYHETTEKRTTPFIYTVNKGNKTRMTTRNVERILTKYADIIRKVYPMFPTVYPHMLRRTRATGWYREGVPIETIAVLLGHSDIKTTRKYYAIPSVEMLRKETEKHNKAEQNPIDEEEQPLWKLGDDDLAKLCGLR